MALKQLVAAGTKLKPFPQDVIKAAYIQSMALYDELSAKNPRWRKVYSDYAKFRKEQTEWFQFTEMGFDRFMQSNKS
jgi:TRAP-type mannitol/chloroaromatic compound transport system substrate-binding protein